MYCIFIFKFFPRKKSFLCGVLRDMQRTQQMHFLVLMLLHSLQYVIEHFHCVDNVFSLRVSNRRDQC